ncbi:MAG: hypothetical protein ACXV3S_05135, partial [Kineosporiaceae bacterium]
MQPSSFVFVAIVGLWAAYLLPQWIRRRDAMAAARGDDRHSLALRVLERRRRRRRPGPSTSPLLTLRPDAAPLVAPQTPDVAPRDVPPPAPGRLAPTPPGAPTPSPQGRTPSTTAPTPTARGAARRRATVLAALVAVSAVAVIGALIGAVPGVAAVAAAALLATD